MARKPVVAVFGSHDISDTPEVDALCENLGRAIIDLGCRVSCGGLGGVMTSVCRGAKSSDNYQSGDTIGILPMDDVSSANPYVDVSIPTGLGLFRNMLVARSGDACIAVSGGSGTLSEIAFAWQIKKPIGTMSSTGGWSEEIAGSTLDRRRRDTVADLANVQEAVNWLKDVLDLEDTPISDSHHGLP